VVKYGGAETGDDDEKYTGDGGCGKVEAAIYDSGGHAGGERYRREAEEKRLNIKFSRGNKLLFPLTICSVLFLLRQFTNFIPRIPLLLLLLLLLVQVCSASPHKRYRRLHTHAAAISALLAVTDVARKTTTTTTII